MRNLIPATCRIGIIGIPGPRVMEVVRVGVQNNLAINIYASRNFITPELPLLSLSSVCRTNNRSSYRGVTLPRVQPPSGFWDGNRIEHIYRTRQWDESRSGPFFTDHEPSSSWWRWWWHSCSFVGRIISQSCVESYPGLAWPDPTSTPYEQERCCSKLHFI